VFADFSFSTFQTLLLDNNSQVAQATLLATEAAGPVEIVTGPDGYIYYLSIYRGELIRIVQSGDSIDVPPVAIAGFETSNDSPLTVRFDATASSDRNSDIVDYQWRFGDGNTGQGVQPVHTYAEPGTYLAELTVTNAIGVSATTTTTVELEVRNVTDSQPVFNSLEGLSPPHYLGSPVSFRISLSNQVNGDPFSVALEFYDETNQSVGTVWLDSLAVTAGSTNNYQFSWLPVGAGEFYVDVSFFQSNRSRRLQPVLQRVDEFEIIPRSQQFRSLTNGGALNPLDVGAILLFVVLMWARRERYVQL